MHDEKMVEREMGQNGKREREGEKLKYVEGEGK